MTHLLKFGLVLAVTVCSLDVAHADPPFAEQTKVLVKFLYEADQLRTHGSQFPTQTRPDEATCSEAIALAIRNGARPDDRLYAGELEYYKPAGWAKDGTGSFILVKDAPKICAGYGQIKRIIPAAGALHTTSQSLRAIENLDPSIVGDTYGAQAVAAGEACVAAVDKALKDGAPGDVAVKVDGKDVTLELGRVQICDAYLAKARTFSKAADTVRKAKFEQAAAPYRALGVKGERLDLFVFYSELGFYVAGCRSETRDRKAIAKARVLFHWLENPDGSHMIRKYVFRGNTVRTTEKTYARKAQAYAGCR